jgi:hypothetical protein
MPSKRSDPTTTTRRTREHIIADLSRNFVERLLLESGHSPIRLDADYGYDLLVQTFTPDGYAETGVFYIQLKATDHIEQYQQGGRDTLAFPIESRHYRLWNEEREPVFLILYDAIGKRAYWLHFQEFFRQHPPRRPNAKSFTVQIPRKNVLGKRTIQRMQDVKNRISTLTRRTGEQS